MSSAPTFDTLRQFAQEILGEKRAADDPGGYSGPSSGPWTSVDDGTRPATTGARAAENEADIKDMPEGSVSVDDTPEASPTEDSQDKVQYNINMTQSAVGEDPAVEDDYKSKKDDPGTDSPFTVSDERKYGSWNFRKCASQLGKLGNEILADVAVKAAKQNKKADAAAKPAAAPAATDAVTKAAQAGYEQAAALGQAGETVAAQQMIFNTVKEASHMADLTVAYLREYHAAISKQADADPSESDSGESHKPKDDDGGAPPGAGGPPGGDPGAGGPPGAGGDALAAMLGPGAGGPGGDPGAGGPPGMDPGAGGPPGGDPMAGGAPSKEESLHELAAAMIEMGISPEELMQAVAQMQPAQAGPVQKAANDVKSYRRSGKFEFGPAKTARAKAIRAEMRTFLQELVSA